MDHIDIYTIEYDDADVSLVNTTTKDSTGKNINFPIPAPTEKFRGKSSSSAPVESQLIETVVNSNGSVTYFYANGSYYLVN